MKALASQATLIRAATFIVLAELLFASMGVAIRQVAETAANEQVVFFRNLFGLSLLLPWIMRHRSIGIRTTVPHLHLLRSLAGLGAMYCFFYAIAHLPLADAMLLKLSSPLFIPLVAAAWLGEPVPWRVRLALGAGFVGVVLVLNPGFSGVNPVAFVALAGGALAAVAKTTVRRLGYSEPPARTVFYFALVGTLVSALPLLGSWQPLGARAYLWLALVAALAAAGQLFLTRGFGLAPAARMGAFGYSAVIFGAAYGWLLWDEVPTRLSILGACLVVAAGLMAGRREADSRPVAAAPRPMTERGS
jgi:drug/metabolite transporter (DMT)-like permease